MTARLLVLAKTPTPGRVKTRLCPPCTPWQAAAIAATALADTLEAADATNARKVLVVDGDYPAPHAWQRVRQRGGPLSDRLADAFAAPSSLLIGMDTPQVTSSLLGHAVAQLATADAVLGFAMDGGWWALGLRDPAHGAVLRTIPTSTATTGADTLAALITRGLDVALLPELRDVDTAVDARAVAAACAPDSRFAHAVHRHLPVLVAS
jgi:glycosyltransferase A (GT-A) superfamily protein (DUF2064 family)